MADDKRYAIRTDRDIDVEQLGALFRAVGFGRRTDPDFLRALLAHAHRVVAAFDDQQLVGFAREVGDGTSNAYISTVCVLPSHQRRGIGQQMLRALLHGQDHVKFVLHTSDAGEALYRSLGFVDAPKMMVRDRR